ncbi:hypothetical protein J4731_22635 [Providencia rettgeri]|nr:hypothetical protein [Providencia rettgeri]
MYGSSYSHHQMTSNVNLLKKKMEISGKQKAMAGPALVPIFGCLITTGFMHVTLKQYAYRVSSKVALICRRK